MRELAEPPCRSSRRRPARHRGHRRRAAELQRLDHGGADRRRRRLPASPGPATARRPSRSGSADVLEALGVRIDLAPGEVADCIPRRRTSASCSPPSHHAATRWVVPVRKELAVRTIFNFLGPLTNPAGATRQLIGVSDPAYLEVMAGAIARLGARRALVVSSSDGMDELCTSGATQGRGGGRRRGSLRYEVAPEDLGLPGRPETGRRRHPPGRTRPSTRSILAGEPGPARDMAVLNGGAAIRPADAAESLEGGVRGRRPRSTRARRPRRSGG